MRDTARKVLGVSSKQRKEDNETWWWDEEVQESIRKKRLAKKRWHIQRDEESKQEYKEMRRETKKAGKDVQQVRMMKDKDGNVMTYEESVLRIWKEYYMGLMNEDNERERRENDG